MRIGFSSAALSLTLPPIIAASHATGSAYRRLERRRNCHHSTAEVNLSNRYWLRRRTAALGRKEPSRNRSMWPPSSASARRHVPASPTLTSGAITLPRAEAEQLCALFNAAGHAGDDFYDITLIIILSATKKGFDAIGCVGASGSV